METELQTFFLIFMRISAFLLVSPGFAIKGLPSLVKISLAGGLSLAAFFLAAPLSTGLAVGAFILYAVKELLLGFAMGYITQLFFTAVEMAGSFADVQVGFAMGEVFDPTMNIQSSYLGRLYYWTALAIFFFTDLHHLVIRALIQSFTYFPLAQLAVGDFRVEGILKLFGIMFETALNLSAPLIIVGLLTEVVLGTLSRTVPQINVLILSMPLKVLAALAFMLAFLPALIRNIGEVLPQMVEYMQSFIQSAGQQGG